MREVCAVWSKYLILTSCFRFLTTLMVWSDRLNRLLAGGVVRLVVAVGQPVGGASTAMITIM